MGVKEVVVGMLRLKLFGDNSLASKVDGSLEMQELLCEVN